MNFIHQVWPDVGEGEVEAVAAYLRSGGWLTEFDRTAEFEKKLGEFLGVPYVTVVPSGTVALYLGLLALDVGPGDSVIVPDYTMIASPNSVRWCGAEVVLCDIEPTTLCLDLDRVELRSTTRALMYVAMNGRAGDLARVSEFCRAHKLRLIEDACQAFGSRKGDRPLGTFGDVGALSFTPHKLITTGQGGAVITSDATIHERVRGLKDFCRLGAGIDLHTDVGYNFKFTDLQAVVGLEQMRSINDRIRRKRELYRRYWEALEAVESVEMLPMDLEEVVPWFVDIFVPADRRRALAEHLKRCGIGSRECYPAVHTQKPYADCSGTFMVASNFSARGLWLPSALQLTNEQVDRVIAAVLDFFRV